LVTFKCEPLIKAIEHLSDRKIFLIIYSLVVILVIDISVTKISAFVGGFNVFQNYYTILFGCIIASFGIIQFIILESVKQRYVTEVAQKKLRLDKLSRLVRYANYGLLAALLSILIQILLASTYSIIFLLIGVWLSYGVSSIMLGFLCILFFRWMKFSRSPVIVIYAIAISMVTINSIVTISFLSTEVSPVDDSVKPSSAPVGALRMSSGSLNNILYTVTSILSFILTWIATVMLLGHYSKEMGKAKYWLMVSVPLVYFIASFQPLILDLFLPARLANPILFAVAYTLFFSAAEPMGAVLFGIAFWALSRRIMNKGVRQYMLICSYGMIILFTSNQPLGLILKPFPAFGLTTISLMPLASYLILMGIYSAAISVSQDSSLKQSIRKDAIKQSDLIGRIAFAESTRQIEKNVTQTIKRVKMVYETESGVTASLRTEDIESYVNEVLKELESTRKK
jgi:hypothetical protein